MGDRLNNYRTHADLLRQVADSEAEEREVRRVLGAPLTEADLDANNAPKLAWPNCCGACGQGRRLCSTPQACQISAEADPPRAPMQAGDLFILAGLMLVSWAALAFTLLAMGVRL